ncbi:MAG: hypothetical protein WBX25_01415 [Rhodomicrobium sp.]
MNIDLTLKDKFAVKNIRFHDCMPAGQELVSILIPVQRGDGTSWEWTTMYQDDFVNLLVEGLTPHFCKFAGDNQVSFVDPTNGSKVFYIAHEIAKAEAGKVVEYIDGNPLNLRRDNLRVCYPS